MPFKLGAAPIRRTIKYLESGPLVFRDKVKCVMVNYNVDEEVLYVKDRPTLHPVRRAAMQRKPWWIQAGPEHKGAQDFSFWNLPQVQYKNPNVQIVVQRNMTPTPFITCFLDDGRKILFDVDSETNTEIMDRLVRTVGKTKETLEEEAIASEKKDNPANFGKDSDRFCICNIPGQLPCPGVIPLPKAWHGKYFYNMVDEDE